MKAKSRDVVAFTLDAFREELRAIYRGAVPEVFSEEFFLSIDDRVRREYGGDESYVQKTPQRAEVNKSKAVQQFAHGAPAQEAAKSNGISRAAIYRALGRKTSSS